MPVRIGCTHTRTPDEKRPDIAGEFRVSCIGIEIVYAVKVKYPAMLADRDRGVAARRPNPAGNQIDWAESRIEKDLRALAKPGAINRCVILRLAPERYRRDNPGHLRRRPGNICAVNTPGSKRDSHVVLYDQLEIACHGQSRQTEHFAMLRVVVAGQCTNP